MPQSKNLFSLAVWAWIFSIINLALIVVVFMVFSKIYYETSPSLKDSDEVKTATFSVSELDIEALNPYGKAIARAGLTQCAQPMNDLSQRLLVNKNVGIYRFPAVHDDFTSLSAEVMVDGGATIYMTFNMTEKDDGSCYISYEAVSDWANTCEDVVKTVFKEVSSTSSMR